MERFAKNFRRLSPSAQKRLTVENDDWPNAFSLADLLKLYEKTGIPLVFDFHHHRFCPGVDGWLNFPKVWMMYLTRVAHCIAIVQVACLRKRRSKLRWRLGQKVSNLHLNQYPLLGVIRAIAFGTVMRPNPQLPEVYKLTSDDGAGVRPVVHWSESQEGRRPSAHSDFVAGPLRLYGLDDQVDVMIEAKAKELALLRLRDPNFKPSAAAMATLGDE